MNSGLDFDPPELPPYAFVPGSGQPHPTGSPEGHSFGKVERPPAIEGEGWAASQAYRHGFVLFEAGFFWEAHEAWEGLWHAHGRKGPVADLLKGLIKLAAAGVKVRQGQVHGVVTHARRAAEAFEASRLAAGERLLGLDLADLIAIARGLEQGPPMGASLPVFSFRIEPRQGVR